MDYNMREIGFVLDFVIVRADRNLRFVSQYEKY